MSTPSADAISQPGLRVVWPSPCGLYRIAAHDWADGAPPSYGVQVRTAGGWDWAAWGSGYHHNDAMQRLFTWLDEERVMDRLRPTP